MTIDHQAADQTAIDQTAIDCLAADAAVRRALIFHDRLPIGMALSRTLHARHHAEIECVADGLALTDAYGRARRPRAHRLPRRQHRRCPGH